MNTKDIEALINNGATIQTKIKILGDNPIELTEENSVKDWELTDERYVPDNGFIGQFVAKSLKGNLKDITKDFNMENKYIELYMGVKIGDAEATFYNLGTYLVDKATNDNVKGTSKFEAQDMTIKFNVPFDYNYTDKTFTKSFDKRLEDKEKVTALWLAQYVCAQAGIELATTNFANNNYIIDSNQFQDGSTLRDVIKAIAQLAYTWVRIDWDDKVYLDFEVKSGSVLSYNKITNDNYYDLTTQKENYGPVNRVTIGLSAVEGDFRNVDDEASIEKDGLCELSVFDNPITYTDELRALAISSGTRLFGLKYRPVEFETTGHPWLKGNELIEVTDMEGNTFTTYPFNRTIKYSGHIRTKITVPAETEVESIYTYEGTASVMRQIKNARIVADKANASISAVVSEIDTIDTTAKEAKNIANTAKTTAESASKTATTATTTASEAKTLATDVDVKIKSLTVGATNALRNTRELKNTTTNTVDNRYNKGLWYNESSWEVAEDTTDSNGAYTAHKSVSGETANHNYGFYSPYVDAEKIKNGFVFSVYIKVDDVDAWDKKGPFIYEGYDSNGNRVGWEDVYIDHNLTNQPKFENGKWVRMTYTRRADNWAPPYYSSGKSSSDISYIGFRLNLVRNGSIWFKLPQLETGSIVTDWYPSPDDFKNDITDLSSNVKSQEEKIQTARDEAVKALSEANKVSKELITNVEVTNYPIVIEDASENNVEKNIIYGNSYQNKQNSPNICPSQFDYWETGDYDGINGNKVVNTSRVRLKDLLPVTPNTTYYIYTFNSDWHFVFRSFKKDKTFNRSIGGIGNDRTLTLIADDYYLSVAIYNARTFAGDYNTIKTLFANKEIKPFICLNTETDKTFKAYTNGQTPNPEYPEYIETVKSCTIHEPKFEQGGMTDKTVTTRIYDYSNFELKKGQTYTMCTDLNTSVFRWAINGSDNKYPINKGNTYDSGWLTSATHTFTPTQDLYLGVPISRIANTDLTPSDIGDAKFWLVLNNAQVPYTPYNNIQEVNIGKNKFNATRSQDTSMGLTYSGDTQYLYMTGTRQNEGRSIYGYTRLPAGTYTWSMELESGTCDKDFNWFLYKSSSQSTVTWNYVSGNLGIGSNSNKRNSRTFTLTEDTGLVISPYMGNGIVTNNLKIKYQIVKGDKPDYDFEPYQETLVNLDLKGNELVKINNVRDEYNVSTGKITKRIGKKVITSCAYYGTYASHSLFYFDVLADAYLNEYQVTAICNSYEVVSDEHNKDSTDETGMKNGQMRIRRGDGRLYWNDDRFTTADEMTAELANNPIVIYYILNEPQEVQLDPAEIPLREGYNELSINAELEPEEMYVNYLTSSALNNQYTTKKQADDINNNLSDNISDLNEFVNNNYVTTASFEASIRETTKSIVSQVSENYVTTADFGEYQQQLGTKLTQTSEGWEFLFQDVTTQITNLNNTIVQQEQDRSKWVRIVDGALVLGEAGNEIMLRMVNNRIAFLQAGNEQAYMSNTGFYIKYITTEGISVSGIEFIKTPSNGWVLK